MPKYFLGSVGKAEAFKRDADGNLTFATVKEIKPLSDDIREWMKLPAGVQI